MTMSPNRWTAIAESEFPWEKEALNWLQSKLPDRDPWRVWSNFEFIDEEGKVNEVDALVLSPAGLFLVEIKSRPGVVSGDAHTWSWTTDDRTYAYDNPLILANRKAKRLASLLRKTQAAYKSKVRIPFVEPLIFLSATSLTVKLLGLARARVYQRGQPGATHDNGIVSVLSEGVQPHPDSTRVDHTQSKTVARAIIEAGIRPSNKHRQIGEYTLKNLISEGEDFQDWEGHHVSLESVRRRVRIHPFAAEATELARKEIQRQAAREFQILEGIDHPGILKVREYKDTERGPALIFDHDPKAQRLDLLLREHGNRLTVDQRLHFLRQIAETLKYAHQKRLYHRTLCPQNVLVRDITAALPTLQIMNWRAGTRDPGSSGGTATLAARTMGTLHVEEYVDDPGRVYLAPEGSWGDQAHGPNLDVFSLGAIAYHLFSGQSPATSVTELHERLRSTMGLCISDVVDGAGKALQDLIQYATIPDTSARFATVDDFLKDLDKVEEELTAPDAELTVDPSVATTNDRLEGGFTVVRRLGKGSSADVLLVRPDGLDEDLVLKVACETSKNEHLIGEGEALAKLRHPNVVECVRTLTVNGRAALLLKRAGDATLAERIRSERLSLDLMRRFGEELIQVVDHLESEGIVHRDIKPANIGVSQVGTKGKLQLVLFDFSLSRTPPENINAGTAPYLDPFLSLRKPPRWDLYAERFALAVTLYEMASGGGELRWGDGQTRPDMQDEEVTLEAERFDPHLREGLSKFFDKALRRDARERFDNAEEMLRDWRKLFDEGQAQPSSGDPLDLIANIATATSSVAELGYSVEAQNVLEGMGIRNVRELLAVDRVKFRYLKNVGDRIRKEIRLKAKRLAFLRPDLLGGRPSLHETDEPAVEGRAGIDELAGQLLPRRPAGEDRADERALSIYLGLEDGTADTLWPTLGDAANECRLARSAVSGALLKARDRWLKSPSVTDLRNEILALLESQGGVVTLQEAARALLTRHGAVAQDNALRIKLAAAVVRASVEAESAMATQRFQVFDGAATPLIALTAEHADYAKRLAKAADEVATADPLLPPQRALEALEACERPSSIQTISGQRLLRLATAAATRAALSSRQEIYPRGMAASLALRQSLGALLGPRFLRTEEVIDRVRGRYPEAEPLSGRPLLDTLLNEVGANLGWRSEGPHGAGYYAGGAQTAPSAGTTTFFDRHGTRHEAPAEVTADIAEARQFEERIDFTLHNGGFLALTVSPRFARYAESELVRRFAPQVLDLDQLFISALQQQAQAIKADWNVVLNADTAAPGSRDHTNLLRLVGKVAPSVRESVLAAPGTVLLRNPGLLARYQLTHLVDELRDLAGHPGQPHGIWMLVPMSFQGLPAIDNVPLPVLSSSQWARIPQAWVENKHRAGTRAAA